MNWIDVKKQLEDSDLDAIEKELQIQLPDEYRSKVKKINGGALKAAYYPSKKYGNIAFARNTNLSPDTKANAAFLAKIINKKDIRYFPFGSVGNGDYFCLDLHNNRVVLYAHEEEKILELCSSYREFMGNLMEK